MKNLASDTPQASKIRILPDKVSNQIAAGEVVERPASVIKELIENSLDAGSGSIEVSFRNGGKSYIEVVDDGAGMGRDDALLAFEPHATSKIMEAEDLMSVTTLGFRGEALPSIGSVSRITLSTCPIGSPTGVEVTFEGGKLINVRDQAPIPGTRIQVRDIFFNTPARRKFLRSESVEAARSQEAVIRQALSRPDVSFRLSKDGKALIEARADSGEDAFYNRIGALYGGSILTELVEVSFDHEDMRLEGFISRPGVNRSSRETQFVYVNGRYVRDRLLGYAIAEGYRSLLPRGRYPFLFLRLTTPPVMVDVNVHPTKTEVRFRDTGSVISLLENGIRNALGLLKDSGSKVFASSSVPVKTDSWNQNPFGDARPISFSQPVADLEKSVHMAGLTGSEGSPEDEKRRLKHFDAAISDNFSPVGQIFGSFILVEEEDRLLLLDQHTVHERILYEKLTKKYSEGKVETQELLFPVEIELSAKEAETVKRNINEFERLGFVLDEFGDFIFMLRAAPALLVGKDYRAIIMDILDTAERFGEVAGFEEVAESSINIMACRGAVKAGQALDRKEIEALVASLKKCVMPYTCPHGRPIALAIEKEDLLKGFLRK